MTIPPRAPRARPGASFGRVAAGVAVATAILAAAPAVAAWATTGVPAGEVASGAVVSAPTGWLRMAHLAPGVGPMDLYLTPLGGSTATVIRHVAYGSFTAYRTLKPGTFDLAIRAAGSAASSAPLASYSVTVRAGTAATIAAVGTVGHLRTELFADALVRPPAGSARIRLIQGAPAAGEVSITAVDGPLLASDVAYGSVTGYADVRQGVWSLKVTEDGRTVATKIDVAAGGVYSLVVLQTSNGGLTLTTGIDVAGKPLAAVGKGSAPISMSMKTDAADSKSEPSGSVNTGEGGTAPDGAAGSSAIGYTGAALAGATGLAAVGALVRRRRVLSNR
jgi:hypothetical protein